MNTPLAVLPKRRISVKTSIKMILAAVAVVALAGCGSGGSGSTSGSTSPTAVAITSFTPINVAGAPVIITGTNFDATAVVKFNGVAATVTSATATQIVTNVPATATTGPITVTVGNQTGTSATNFTVSNLTLAINSATFTTYSTSVPNLISGTYNVSSTYSTSHPYPHPISGTYNVSFANTAGGTEINIGLSNSPIVYGAWGSVVGYQNLNPISIILPGVSATDQTGIFTAATNSNGVNFMILSTPFYGIDYSKPTYIIVTLSSPDLVNTIPGPYGSKAFGTVYVQKAMPITITP